MGCVMFSHPIFRFLLPCYEKRLLVSLRCGLLMTLGNCLPAPYISNALSFPLRGIKSTLRLHKTFIFFRNKLRPESAFLHPPPPPYITGLIFTAIKYKKREFNFFIPLAYFGSYQQPAYVWIWTNQRRAIHPSKVTTSLKSHKQLRLNLTIQFTYIDSLNDI